MRQLKKTQIHGHRGCRGYHPENTINGFLFALELGVDAIEMDVVISKDHKVVVSHEPFMHHKKCLKPEFVAFSANNQHDFILYQMDYEIIKTFDCGTLKHPAYPKSMSYPAYKPLLSEVIAATKNNRAEPKSKFLYNIEIKSEPRQQGISQPDYHTYANLVLDTIIQCRIEEHTVVQSFDKEMLSTIRKINSNLPLALLIEDDKDPYEHIKELGFKPDIFSCQYQFLSEKIVASLHQQNIAVYAFTVNNRQDIINMLNFNVEGIITDYPDLALRLRDTYIKPEK